MVSADRILAGALFAALLGVATGPVSAAAQASLRGRVIDSEMGHPLAGAAVRIGKDTTSVTTDSLGFFHTRSLPRGVTDVRIHLVGYEDGLFRIYIPDSGSVHHQFALDFNGFMLPEVVVQARAEVLQPRYVDFERRRVRKLGAFLRWDDLKKQSHSSIGDALRTVRGVRIQCDQASYECFAVMVRTPQCHPTWYVDGVEVHSFHENTPIRDVYGIEVYRGAGEIPGEFAGSDAACGVIVVWTKSRPFRISP